MGEQQIYEAREVATDLLYEVLRRVDGVTLATSSCVSSSFLGVCRDEMLWEQLCSARWPSTRDPRVKSLVRAIGGFRRFFKECYPLILSREPLRDADEDADPSEFWWDSDEEESEVPLDRSPSHFISIVDVVFQGKPVYSRMVEGIPGADDYLGWFSSCPFRIDLFKPFQDDECGVIPADHLPSVESLDREKKEGKLWKALLEGVRVSWILIDKRTQELANLTSWRPIMGQRHWPTDEGFFLRFGSVLPSSANSVQCSIVVRFKFSTSAASGARACLKLVELSMQLEDMAGLHLNGRDSVAVLYKALKSSKSYKHTEVLSSLCSASSEPSSGLATASSA